MGYSRLEIGETPFFGHLKNAFPFEIPFPRSRFTQNNDNERDLHVICSQPARKHRQITRVSRPFEFVGKSRKESRVFFVLPNPWMGAWEPRTV